MKRCLFPLLVLVFACCLCPSGCTDEGVDELDGHPQPSNFQFVQVSDIHIGKSLQQEENLRHALAQINQTEAAVVLLTGDLTDHGRVEEYATLKDVLSGLSGNYYCVPGDNDILDGEGDLDRYRDELGADFYALDHAGLRFIGINNVAQLSLDEDQRAWLSTELGDERRAIVFAHKPLLDKNQQFQPLGNAQPLLSLLESDGVLIYMSGEVHESAEVNLNGIYHIWCDNLSFFHTNEETYNLYRVGSDRVELYHVHFDGTEEFVLDFPSASGAEP